MLNNVGNDYCKLLGILKPIIINIRGQIENRPLENKCCSVANGSQRAANSIFGPAADCFLDHHPINFNQSGDFVDTGKPFTAVSFEVNTFNLTLKVRCLERKMKAHFINSKGQHLQLKFGFGE